MCPKELSFRIKVAFFIFAYRRGAVLPESNPGKHSPSRGERHSDVFETELALSLKKDKPMKTILTQVVSYKTMVNFFRVIIII